MPRSVSVLIALFVSVAAGAFMFPAHASAQSTELFFSEYIEGSSNNKALEIYNGTALVRHAVLWLCERAGAGRSGIRQQ